MQPLFQIAQIIAAKQPQAFMSEMQHTDLVV